MCHAGHLRLEVQPAIVLPLATRAVRSVRPVATDALTATLDEHEVILPPVVLQQRVVHVTLVRHDLAAAATLLRAVLLLTDDVEVLYDGAPARLTLHELAARRY